MINLTRPAYPMPAMYDYDVEILPDRVILWTMYRRPGSYRIQYDFKYMADNQKIKIGE